MNGDGRDDLAIGAPDAEVSDGEAYIIWSSSLTDENFLSGAKLDLADSVFNAGGGALIVGSDNSGQFGYKLVSAGDFDGDGSNDFFVSSPSDSYSFDDGSGYLLSETILGSANSRI